MSPVPSYDAYSSAWVARAFATRFGERYRRRGRKELEPLIERKSRSSWFQKQYPTEASRQARKPVRNVRLRLDESLRDKPLAFISPHGQPKALTADGRTVTVPLLDVFGAVVACPDAATRDAMVERNRLEVFQPAEGGTWLRHWSPSERWKGITPFVQKRPEDLQAGQKLCWIRQYFQAGVRRMDADIVTRGTGNVGTSQTISLNIHKLGGGSIYLDNIAFVMVNTATGKKDTVPVEVAPLSPEEQQRQADLAAEAARIRSGLKPLWEKPEVYWPEIRKWTQVLTEQLVVPAKTLVRRHARAKWTPTVPGRYQAYLSYRYVDATSQGLPDLRTSRIISGSDAVWGDHMRGRPYLKPVYEQKLPALIVDVSP